MNQVMGVLAKKQKRAPSIKGSKANEGSVEIIEEENIEYPNLENLGVNENCEGSVSSSTPSSTTDKK